MLPEQKGHRPVRNFPGPFQSSTYRKFQFDSEIALVLLRYKARRDYLAHYPYSDYSYAEKGEHPAAMMQTRMYHSGIEGIAFCESFIYLAEYDILFLVWIMRLEKQRAHYRTKRKGYDRRNDYRNRNRHGKLPEKLPCNS